MCVPFAFVAALSLIAPDVGVIGTPLQLFVVVVAAASLCAVAAGALLWRAHRTDAAELGWVALFFLACSLLPFVLAITTPGVLSGAHSTTGPALTLAMPLAPPRRSSTGPGPYLPLARS